MRPAPHRVAAKARETDDTVTLTLTPVEDPLPRPLPGQFMMVYAFGIGEIPLSVSGIAEPHRFDVLHTVRAVGGVSRALHDAAPGDVLGVRGPFGTHWDLPHARGRDLVMVAGGVGLAPLRALAGSALSQSDRFGRVTVIVGARTRADVLFAADLMAWSRCDTATVHTTVDVPLPGWLGEVGLVTDPLRRLVVEPDRTAAFLCGPEPMMRACAEILLDKGLQRSDIQVSLERNMQCGIGWCGHCQLGPLLLCRDGPIVGYDVADAPLRVAEL